MIAIKPPVGTVVELDAEIDGQALVDVIATLNAAVKQRSSTVIVSFERNTYFESGLLKTLMRVGESLIAAQRRLVIVMPRDHPGRRIFHLLNLDKMFECYESSSLALRDVAPMGASRGSDRARLSSWARPHAGSTA